MPRDTSGSPKRQRNRRRPEYHRVPKVVVEPARLLQAIKRQDRPPDRRPLFPSRGKELLPQRIEDVGMPSFLSGAVASDDEDLILDRARAEQGSPGKIAHGGPPCRHKENPHPLLRHRTNELGKTKIVAENHTCPEPAVPCLKEECTDPAPRGEVSVVPCGREEVHLLVPVDAPPAMIHTARVCGMPAGGRHKTASGDTDHPFRAAQTRKGSLESIVSRVPPFPSHKGGVPSVDKLWKDQYVTLLERAGKVSPGNPATGTRKRQAEDSLHRGDLSRHEMQRPG